MRKDVILNKDIYSSFFSCETDAQTIIRKLFVQSNPYWCSLLDMKLEDMDLGACHEADREGAGAGAFADEAFVAAECVFAA